MRKIMIVFGMLVFCAAGALMAQVSVGVHINIGLQPIWGPVGYDYVEYYYLPGIDVYYDVGRHRFCYYEGDRWIFGAHLPYRYRDYDLFNCYKVVVNERDPWRRHHVYRDRYESFRDRHDQQPIRDSRDPRYFVNRRHPEHENWVRQQRGDHGGYGNRSEGNASGQRGDNGYRREDRSRSRDVQLGNEGPRSRDVQRGNEGPRSRDVQRGSESPRSRDVQRSNGGSGSRESVGGRNGGRERRDDRPKNEHENRSGSRYR